ncbi:eukaryotic type KH-domain (KH-domain type I) [Daldinia loculata]|uniref:eukaryotic type KH-domain (KH-domain type I) n=1 Tax=Daldinia loculata TaxID=103429 RepID=UPI0020C4940E|nr:eukaryotic type KH-domain (KH-domain type I) [Daldinia loculata]KAI1649473.1 eukaryotic type KH-domain (KH-domain type I) [Daldinia loculata]
MAEAQPNVQAILAALAAAQTGTPTQGQTPYAMPGYQQGPPPNAYATLPPTTQPSPYATGAYPPVQQSSAPGGFDLSAIRPITSGTVNLGDAIAKAKNYATEQGLTPYERPAVGAYQGHDAHTVDARHYRSRSRSPPTRRENFRDNVNPYRDERRNDRGGAPTRDYGRGRDRSLSPGPSRGRVSGGLFSPRDDDDSEVISIESSLVGLIIGRQGENLRRVESETSCRVQFLSPTGEPGPYRQCKITGPRAKRAEAKASINRIIEDSGMGALARAGLDKPQHARRDNTTPTPATLRDGEDCMQIMVPDRTVGLIIGRGGETIRDLQERSGCHINIVGEDQSVDGLRPVNLIGPPNAASQAKELILEIVASDSRNVNNNNTANTTNDANKGRPQRTDQVRDNSQGAGDKINDSIFVPGDAVGMIIGRGGETIREMQNTTGCKINVTASVPGQSEREIGLIGSHDAINRAKRAIEDKVDAVRQKNNGGNQSRPPRNQHRRDWDNPNPNPNPNPNYGQQQQSNQAAEPAGANPASDPYAAYGGYQQYLALWYQAYAQQQPGSQPQGEAPPPPGA